MSLAGRNVDHSPNLTPLHQVGAVWLALVAVLLTLSLLFLAYGWRSYDFTAKRAQTQSQSRAELTRSQVLNAFRHMDDILLQTKSVYERAGPGIASQAGMLAQSSAPLGQAPYTCIGIVNSVGDAFFRIPENCTLPDISAKSGDFQPMGSAGGRLFTEAFQGAEGLHIVRAVPLYYADETFAGMVLAVLSTDYVFSVFQGLDPKGHHIDLEMMGKSGPAFIAHSGASAATGSIGASKSVLEFEGFSGPLRLEIRSSVSRSAAMNEWAESVFWPFLGYLLVVTGLVQGARVLTRALRRQVASDLLAQRVRVESEVQSRFIANISHEVRTPMNGVLGAARLLGKTPLTESQRQLLGLVERSGKVLLGTINDLLDIGKLREGHMHLEQQPVNLVELLEDSCALQAPQAFAKDLDLVVMLDLPDNLGAMGDPLRIQQVASNLLNNAVKFTADGMVCLTASLFRTQAGAHLKLEVADSGMGIDLAEADWLFQPFQQADASTARRFGGTGLGLAITDQLVRLMGGVLEVHSELGVGTTFTARWPLVLSDGQRQDSDDVSGWPEQIEPLRLPKNLVCQLELVDSKAGQRERMALARQLEHIGIEHTQRQAETQGRSSPEVPHAQVVLLDEHCLLRDRPEWLEQQTMLIILSREPGAFRLPVHLDALNWQVIAKPARRSALTQALRQGLDTLGTSNEAIVNRTNVHQVAQRVTGVQEPSATSRSLDGLHVLVAEDHPVNQILIRHMLQAAGCEVELVSDGLQVIDALFRPDPQVGKPFDAVLMDCQMPQLDGFSATERIRRRQALMQGGKYIPIIAMTALAMPEDKQRCLDSGMDDYCSKPIDERTLIEKIVRWTQPLDR